MYFRQTRRVVSRQYITSTRHYFTSYPSYCFSHTEPFTHRRFCTEAVTHRSFYTQELLHTETFTHRRFYTQKLLHTEAFTHRSFCNRIVIAKVIQLVFVADLLVEASRGCRDAFKAILSTSFFCGYGLAFILWRLCFVIGNSCIESWYLFPVEVTCDCRGRFVFS